MDLSPQGAKPEGNNNVWPISVQATDVQVFCLIAGLAIWLGA